MARRSNPIVVRSDDEIPTLRRPVQTAPSFKETVEIYDDVEQQSEEWFTLRLGLPTASNFAAILANGRDGGESKMRSKLLRRLAGERLTGQPSETYSNAAMARGSAMETEAREDYAFNRDVELERVGFVRREIAPGRFVGCSPDSLIGDDGALEIKTMIPDLMIELIESGRFPSEHRAQCQGTLWVTGRKWIDLRIYYTGMPIAPTFRVERDDAYISIIRQEVEKFEWEVRKLVERIKAMGGQK